MQVSPVAQNNTNFQAAHMSLRTRIAVGFSKRSLLKQCPALKKAAKKYSVVIKHSSEDYKLIKDSFFGTNEKQCKKIIIQVGTVYKKGKLQGDISPEIITNYEALKDISASELSPCNYENIRQKRLESVDFSPENNKKWHIPRNYEEGNDDFDLENDDFDPFDSNQGKFFNGKIFVPRGGFWD